MDALPPSDLDRGVEPSFSCDLRPNAVSLMPSSTEHRARSPFTSSQTQLVKGDPALERYRYYKQAFQGIRPTPLLPGTEGSDTDHQISFTTSVPPLLATPAELSLLEPREAPLLTHASHGNPIFRPAPNELDGMRNMQAPPPPHISPHSDTYLSGLTATTAAHAAAAAAAAGAGFQNGHSMEPDAKHRRTVSSPSVWDPQQWDPQHPQPCKQEGPDLMPQAAGLSTSPGNGWGDMRQLVTLPPGPPGVQVRPASAVPGVGSCSSTGGTPLASPLASNVPSGACSPVGRLSGTNVDLSGLHQGPTTPHPGATHGLSPTVPSSPTMHQHAQQQATNGAHHVQPSISTKLSSGGGTGGGATSSGGGGGTNGQAQHTITSGTAVPSDVVQELLSDVPPELQPVVLAKVTQRGRGGRAPAADPRTDPNIDPRKARRILANRQSAARSKLKQKMLLETLRVNKEVLAVQQGSVQGEVARLQQLVAALTQRNRELEEQVQALTLQQRMSSVGGMTPSVGASNGWQHSAAASAAAMGAGSPLQSGVIPPPMSMSHMAMNGVAMPGGPGVPGMGMGSNGMSRSSNGLHHTMGASALPVGAGMAMAARSGGSQTMHAAPGVDDEEDGDGWWKAGMELGN